jgi:cytidylate kinase
MIVTIDGPAGVGKSTVARRVAESLGVPYVDTGSMYRELTATALERHADLDDEAVLAALVGVPPVAATDLRSERISAAVSSVSRHPLVRSRMLELQRNRAGDAAVLEGRDTGSRVRPDAAVKIYLTAPVAVRAARRAADLGLPVGEIERTIAARDARDAAQMPAAPDAHVLDTAALDADQVTERVLELVRSAGG